MFFVDTLMSTNVDTLMSTNVDTNVECLPDYTWQVVLDCALPVYIIKTYFQIVENQ